MKTFSSFSQFLLLLAGTLTSCFVPQSIPKDFYVKIEGTPSQPGAGGAHVLVVSTKSNNTKEPTFEWTLTLNDTTQSVKLPDSVVQKLVDELRISRVFTLEDRYSNYNILDGGTDVFTIRMNGREKIITMDNSSPKELEKFFRLIYRPLER